MGKHAEIVGPQGNHVAHDFEYADTATREAATGLVAGDLKKLALQLDNNTLWILTATTPTWAAVTGSGGGGETLASILGVGNNTAGNAIIVDTGDNITLTDLPVLGLDAANKDYVDALSVPDSLAAVLGAGNVSGGSDIVVDAGDKITLTDAPVLATDAVNKSYADGLIITSTLAQILATGNTSGGSDLIMSDGDTLDLLGTTSAMKLNRMTTTQRDLLTPAAGMLIFNTTENKVQEYTGTEWLSIPKRTISLEFGARKLSKSTDDRWLWPGWQNLDAVNVSTSEHGYPAPFDYIITEIAVYNEDPAGNGNDIIYRVRQDNVTSLATVTLASTGTDAVATSTVTGSAGDKISLLATKALDVGVDLGDVTVTVVLEEQ